ncbi:MAG: hypothetical protein IT440_07925 [Phycisphaeraceae bacterium]|nr:hypothetical protein [Phycisphaeraceae bacterium]
MLAILGSWPATAMAQTSLEKTFVRGVYYGNAMGVNAAAAGKDVPAFKDQLFRDLTKTYHCNLLWLNSGGLEDQVETLDIAGRHGLGVLCDVAGLYSSLLGPMVSEDVIAQRAKQIVDAFGSKPACAGYVLWDEPPMSAAPQLEHYRQLLARLDPTRPGMVVSMPPQTSVFAYRTGFPILCADMYVFGGPNWTHSPNTPERSVFYYTQLIKGLGDMSVKSGKPGWAMPQAYAAADGVTWVNDKGHLIIEAGSAWANRMPTPAEIKFQIWEAVRGGCRGVLFFLLMPYLPDWRPDKADMTEAEKKWGEHQAKTVESLKNQSTYPLTKERVDTGEAPMLLQKNGGPTRQSKAMGEAFAELEKLDALVSSWKPAAFPVAFANAPAAVGTFESPAKPEKRYVVVVNHDTAAKQTLTVLLNPNVSGAKNLCTGQDVAVTPSVNDPDNLRCAAVALEAGDGAVLELSFTNDQPGIPLFDEDFSRFCYEVVLENAERINFPYPSGMGDYWGVKKVRAPGTDGARASGMAVGKNEGPISCVKMIKLDKNGFERGQLGGNLAMVAQGTHDILLAIEGSYPRTESLIIEAVDEDGKANWLRTDNFFRPVHIPASNAGKKITEIRFVLADDAMLTRIRAWRVPRAGK